MKRDYKEQKVLNELINFLNWLYNTYPTEHNTYLITDEILEAYSKFINGKKSES